MAEQTLLTYADLVAMPDDNVRREIIGGELIVSPSPKVRHQELVTRLIVAFYTHLSQHGGGRVLPAPMDVVLSNIDVVEPDVLFVSDDQSDIVGEMNIAGVPALLIEVLSDPRMDRKRKRDLYARFGAPEYWIVDPDADRVEVYRLREDGYGKPELFEPPETLGFDKLPGFTLDLTALFARPEA